VIRASAVAVAVLVATALSGCVFSHSYSPDDPGIPEARAEAREQIDEISAALAFSPRVVVLGTGTTDDCSSIRNWWFDNSDLGYRCWMRWTAVAVIPDATDREELIAAIESEVAALDLPFTRGAMLRDYIELYPDQRDGMPIGIGGGVGDVGVGISTEPFRAESWRNPVVGGGVSSSGDAEAVTVADIESTGAQHVLTIHISTEYWSTDPDPGPRPEPDPVEGVPEGVALKYWSYGDLYAFDLASLDPGFPDACLADPAIDPSSVVRSEQPFARLRFSLVPGAESLDSQRIRDCLVPQLAAGTTLVVYRPFTEPGDP
jgi:hypothetical protein